MQEAQKQLKAQHDLLSQVRYDDPIKSNLEPELGRYAVRRWIHLNNALFFFLILSKQRPNQKEETTYTNWMDTLTIICDDMTMESQVFLQYLWQSEVKVVH